MHILYFALGCSIKCPRSRSIHSPPLTIPCVAVKSCPKVALHIDHLTGNSQIDLLNDTLSVCSCLFFTLQSVGKTQEALHLQEMQLSTRTASVIMHAQSEVWSTKFTLLQRLVFSESVDCTLSAIPPTAAHILHEGLKPPCELYRKYISLCQPSRLPERLIWNRLLHVHHLEDK